MEKVASLSSKGTRTRSGKVTVRSNKKRGSAKKFTTKPVTVRPPRHSSTVANLPVTAAECSSSSQEDDNEEYMLAALGKWT